MGRTPKLIVLALSLVVFSYVALGYVLGKTQEDRTYLPLGVFSEVLQHVQQDYVEEPNLAVVTTGALRGLLESLDPHSAYLSPQEYAEFKKRSQNPGKGEIGVVLSKRFGYIIVVSVLPDSPAQKAGLRAGNILEAIEGFTTRELSVGQAELLLAGEPGTAVKVSVVRSGRTEPEDAEITRAVVPAPKVQAEKVEGDIAHLSLVTLTPGKANEIREKLIQLDHQGVRKLILDLRDCARGDVSEAVVVARLFLPSGTITTLRGQALATQQFVAEPSKVVWKQPVTVLISSSTSGAAEVLAAAIGGNQRGDLVGERTFGTAAEQKTIPLEDGAALILTAANYYTPAGKSIPDEGVAPTVEVRASSADVSDQDDGAPPASSASPEGREDPVLKKAIELLKAQAPTQKDEAALRRTT